MSLSDLASIGNFVSGIAVVESLVYLAIQTRQGVRNQRSIIRREFLQHSVSFADKLIADKPLAEPSDRFAEYRAALSEIMGPSKSAVVS
jgi:hypothetical protein